MGIIAKNQIKSKPNAKHLTMQKVELPAITTRDQPPQKHPYPNSSFHLLKTTPLLLSWHDVGAYRLHHIRPKPR